MRVTELSIEREIFDFLLGSLRGERSTIQRANIANRGKEASVCHPKPRITRRFTHDDESAPSSSSSLLSSPLLEQEENVASYRNARSKTRRSKLDLHASNAYVHGEREPRGTKGSKGIEQGRKLIASLDPSNDARLAITKSRRRDHPGHSAGDKPSNKLYTITNVTLGKSWSFLSLEKSRKKIRDGRCSTIDSRRKCPPPLHPFSSIFPAILLFRGIRRGILDDESRTNPASAKRGNRGRRKNVGKGGEQFVTGG